MQAEAQYKTMIETPVSRLVISMAVPAVISMLVTSVYNLADTWFVSQLGTSASGAVGIVFSLMSIIQAVGFSLGQGAGNIASRLLGAKRDRDASIIAVSAFSAAFLFGVLLAVFGLQDLDGLMHLLGASDTILVYARDYAFYILLAAPAMTASFVANSLLRAEGGAKFAMVGLTIGGILNIILDPIFIFVLNLGIAGAAIATAISQLVSFCVLLSMYIRRKTVIALDVRRISREPATYFAIFKNGTPSLFRLGLASIATILLNTATANYGDSAVAAMGIVSKIVVMMFSASVGIGQGYQPVAGYNYGAKKYARVRAARIFTVKASTLFIVLCAGAVFLLADVLVKAFIPDDPAVHSIGAYTLRVQCLAFPLVPYSIISNMTFQALGKPFRGALLASCRQGVFLIPLLLILPRIGGLFGIQVAQAVSDVITFFFCIPFMYFFFKKMPLEDQ